MESSDDSQGGFPDLGLRWSLNPWSKVGIFSRISKDFSNRHGAKRFRAIFRGENDNLLTIFVTGTGSETPCKMCRVFYLSVQVRLWTLILKQASDSTNFTIENRAWSLDPLASKTRFRLRNFSVKIATKLVLDSRCDTHGWDPWVTSSILICKITTFDTGFARFRHFSFWNNYFTSVCLRYMTSSMSYTCSILDQLCNLKLDVNQISIWLEHPIFQSWSYFQVSSRARKIRLCWIPGHFHFIQTWFPNFDFGLLQLFWNLTNDPDTASGMLCQFFEYSRPWTHSQLAPCLHEPICTNLLQNQRWRRHLESSSKEP